MSYDIRFGVEVKGADGTFVEIGRPDYDSPTYNIGEMFRTCMDWNFKQGEWYKVSEVVPNIGRGISELLNNESEYEKYEAPNGWGTTSSALECLVSIRKWLTEFKEIHEEIPINCIYIKW